MGTMPTIESLLLEVHQSLCQSKFTTKEQNTFASFQVSMDKHKKMIHQIIDDVCTTFSLDEQTSSDLLVHVEDFISNYKKIDFDTFTYNANDKQVLWIVQNYIYAPYLGRMHALWNIGGCTDEGMPGGSFWYLPMQKETSLYLPVAQVVDWLLDLLGFSVEEFSDKYYDNNTIQYDSANGNDIRRSLYNWRNGTTIKISSIEKYFSDEINIEFNGAFILNKELCHEEQFASALDFLQKKKLTVDMLRHEIPMTAEGRLEAILSHEANIDEQKDFVECIAKRYAIPSNKTIRHRLQFARMVQDGYVRLLKYLCPDVDKNCADYSKNKILQSFEIYKAIYNATIDAHRHCKEQGIAAEDDYFEKNTPYHYRIDMARSLMPSNRQNPAAIVAEQITRHFKEINKESVLEDFVLPDGSCITNSIKRYERILKENIHRITLIEQLQKSSPWRTLQKETDFTLLISIYNVPVLNTKIKNAIFQRLQELVHSPEDMMSIDLLELERYLNVKQKGKSKDMQEKVHALLEKVEANELYEEWKAPILQFKAKHFLSINNFDEAKKLFKEAFKASFERQFGSIRYEIAKDCFAVELAHNTLNSNNHQKYYKEILSGNIIEKSKNGLPSMEDVARAIHIYFWEDLYKPYFGVPKQQPLAKQKLEALVKQIFIMTEHNQESEMREWIKSNRKLLNDSSLDVEKNSVLMLLIKAYHSIENNVHINKIMSSLHSREETLLVENFVKNVRIFIKELIQMLPKQVNICDLKGQTPLMLVAERGDTELVKSLLSVDANPEIQDWNGMTALDYAIKSHVHDCVDTLLDFPCSLDKKTIDGRSPLHTASLSCNLHAVERLIKLEPTLVGQKDDQEQSPIDLVEILVNHPQILANFIAQHQQHNTPQISREALLKVHQKLEIAQNITREN